MNKLLDGFSLVATLTWRARRVPKFLWVTFLLIRTFTFKVVNQIGVVTFFKVTLFRQIRQTTRHVMTPGCVTVASLRFLSFRVDRF